MWRKIIVTVISLLLLSGQCFAGGDFDGVDDSASTTANNALDGYNVGTVAFWVRFDNIADGVQYAMGSYNHGANAEVSYQFLINDSGFIKLAWKCDYPLSNWAEIVAFTTDLTGNTGSHLIVYVADGTNQVKLYLDGAEETASYNDGVCALNSDSMDFISDQNGIGSFNHRFSVGAWPINALYNPFNGVVWEVAIWNTALTAAEVKTYYDSKLKMHSRMAQPSALTFYWALDEKAHGTALNGVGMIDYVGGWTLTADDGANNSGMSAAGDTVINYPSGIIGQ